MSTAETLLVLWKFSKDFNMFGACMEKAVKITNEKNKVFFDFKDESSICYCADAQTFS